jgi:hypothetical protein
LYSSVIRDEKKSTEKKPKYSDAMKAKPAHIPQSLASTIRKNSIEQLTGPNRSNLTKGIKEVEKATKMLQGIPVENTASQPQNTVEELKLNFKPFAKDLKNQLNSRRDEISKSNRILEELKQFSKEFHIPENLKKKATSPLEKSPTSSKASPQLIQPTAVNIKTTPKPDSLSTSMDSKKLDKPKERPNSEVPAVTSPEIPESVVSEAESHATNYTAATSTTASKPKSNFKLSAKAAEFTPKGFVPPIAGKPKTDKNGKPLKGQTPPQCKLVIT